MTNDLLNEQLSALVDGELPPEETALLFNELLDRYPRWELAGEPKEIIHILRSGWHEIPLVFGA